MVNEEIPQQEEGDDGGDWEAELGSQRDVRVCAFVGVLVSCRVFFFYIQYVQQYNMYI